MDTLEKIDNYKKQCLKELLDQCTEDQQKLFFRMYESIDKIPDEQFNWAVKQCERTIKKNKEKELPN